MRDSGDVENSDNDHDRRRQQQRVVGCPAPVAVATRRPLLVEVPLPWKPAALVAPFECYPVSPSQSIQHVVVRVVMRHVVDLIRVSWAGSRHWIYHRL